MPMIWNEELSVGDDAIDGEHREIMSVIGSLCDALDVEDGLGEASVLLGKVIDLISVHYEREEILMRGVRFPGAERHAREHNQFFKELTTLLDLLEKGSNTVKEDLRRCLHRWAFEHVRTFDRSLGLFLINQRMVAA